MSLSVELRARNSPLEREGDALSAQIENMAHLAHKDQISLLLLAERRKSLKELLGRNISAGRVALSSKIGPCAVPGQQPCC
jgi:hypothetical protein